MSCRLSFGLIAPLAAGLVFTASGLVVAGTPEDVSLDAGVESFRDGDGTTWFALKVRADTLPNSVQAQRHIVMVDTSASQTGDYREHALAVLKALLGSLDANSRVALFAVDVTAPRLSDGFVPPRGPQIDQAVARLGRRVPLGATNLPHALETASEYAGTNSPTSVLYIGDGLSIGGLLDAEALQRLVEKLRAQRIAVNTYAVGHRTDLELPGVLAQHSGGILHFDRGAAVTTDPAAVGKSLAAALAEPVTFVDEIVLSGDDVQLLPSRGLPLRSDRATVYLGRRPDDGLPSAALTGQIRIGGHSFRFAASEVQDSGNGYLRPLFRRARDTGGFAVSMAGDALLELAKSAYQSGVEQLVEMTDKAYATGNLDRVEQLAAAVREADPDNVHAVLLLRKANQDRVRRVARVQPTASAAASSADDSLGAPSASERDVIADEEQLRAVRLDKLRFEVAQAIQVARRMQREEPDAAVSLLKEVLATVASESRIDANGRRELQRRVTNALEESQSVKDRIELDSIRLAERLSAEQERRSLLDSLAAEELELDRLTDMVRGLLDDARHGDDDAYEEAEAVSRVAVDMKPGNGTAAAALFNSEAAGQLNKAFRLVSLRRDQFLATLYQVELSHVPFPDEPPIRWPDAGLWRELSVRRQKWASVDLKQDSPAAQKILAALDHPIETMNFVDDPMTTVLEFIEQVHGFQIELDKPALAEEGIDLDNIFVNVELSGITLRSALRIILDGIEDAELDYTIKNEVMYLTTAVAMEDPNNFQTRVYPVGDLVIPPQQLGGGGGGGLGGGGLGGGIGGGFGGGGLGGGLGGGIGGGGFGGGGFGGGGGGLFSLPPASIQPDAIGLTVPADKDEQSSASASAGRRRNSRPSFRLTNESIRDLKKKPRDGR